MTDLNKHQTVEQIDAEIQKIIHANKHYQSILKSHA
jgi:hypothetical protein